MERTEDGEKFHKTLLLLLCSDKAGEVVAARNALLRIAGIGPHELAQALTDGPTSDPPEPTKQARKAADWQSVPKNRYQEMALECVRFYEDGGRLTERELAFVQDMVDWDRPSEKQIAWLEKIHVRVSGCQGW